MSRWARVCIRRLFHPVAQLLVGQACPELHGALAEPVLQAVQAFLQAGRSHALARRLQDTRMGEKSSLLPPHAGQDLGNMQHLDLFPPPRQPPAIFIRQLISQPTTASAPVARILSIFSSTMASADLRIIDAEGAAEAAAGVAVTHLDQVQAPDVAEQLPGLPRMPRARLRWQES